MYVIFEEGECWELHLLEGPGGRERVRLPWLSVRNLNFARQRYRWGEADPRMCNGLIGLQDSRCRSDYCGLLTKPASTTCSHCTPPASDKLSSLQIETNDLPLRHSPTACDSVCVCVCTINRRSERQNGGK